MTISHSALSFEECQALEEAKILLSGPTNGKRKVSAALLSPPSSHGSMSSSTSASSASIRIRPFDPSSNAPFDLPENTESVAALEFLGFTRKVSGQIFERWAARSDPQQNPDDLLQYAIAEVGKLNFQPFKDLPTAEAMISLGIADELQMALLDPRYTQIFRSQTLDYWLKDTMSIRKSALNKLLERLKSRAVRTIATRKEKKGPKIASSFESGTSSSTPPPLTHTTSSNIESEEEALPRTCMTVQAPPPVLADHYIFYKGKAVGDMNEDMFIREDGSVHIDLTRTERGGDFNQQNPAWYWTEEEETAEMYRKWGEQRCQHADTWVIQIQVPKTFIDALKTQQLWYSADWKEYIWYCRKGTSVEDPPAKFDKLWKPGQAQLVQGHICARAPALIPRIKKEDVQDKISESDVMKIAGRKATQSVFMDTEVVKQLGVIIRGKIYIEIYPAVAALKTE